MVIPGLGWWLRTYIVSSLCPFAKSETSICNWRPTRGRPRKKKDNWKFFFKNKWGGNVEDPEKDFG